MTTLNKNVIPSFSLKSAENFILTYFGISGTANNLVGYTDQNFHIQSIDKQEYVLKIMNLQTSKQVLQVHNEMMLFLQQQIDGLAIPQVITNIQGAKISEVQDNEGNCFCLRLLSWVEGQLWENIAPNNLRLYEELGQKLGKMSHALQQFILPCSFPALGGFHWETSSAHWIEETLQNIKEEKDRKTIEYFLGYYSSVVKPNIAALRNGFIHNDANTFNILVSNKEEKQEVVGLIDFGLALPSKIVCELAVACAYLSMKRPNPLEIVAAITKGFHAIFPLNDAELKAIFPLMAHRLMISVAHSGLNRKNGISAEYVYTHENHAWDLLRQMEMMSPSLIV